METDKIIDRFVGYMDNKGLTDVEMLQIGNGIISTVIDTMAEADDDDDENYDDIDQIAAGLDTKVDDDDDDEAIINRPPKDDDDDDEIEPGIIKRPKVKVKHGPKKTA